MPRPTGRGGRGDTRPETFDFLGLTHICSRSRRGSFQLARHTRRERKMAKLLEISEDLRRRWHQDIAEQGRWLGSVVRGFFACHAVPTNHRALSAFRHHVVELWRRALRRHSQRDRTSWTDMDRLADRWLPPSRAHWCTFGLAGTKPCSGVSICQPEHLP
jgi:RNA-directed DNA polymerase